MERQDQPRRRRWWPWVGAWLPGVLLGCTHTGKCDIDNCASIPKGAIPPPTGTYVREFQNRQAAKAESDDFTIYKHEWFKGGRELGPYGESHLGRIIRRLPGVPFPVVIEPVRGDEPLNFARRSLIVARLQAAGFPDAERRVFLGFPAAGGLYGEEAERIYQDMLQSQDTSPFGSGFGRNLFGGFGGFGGLGGFGGFGGPFGGGFGSTIFP